MWPHEKLKILVPRTPPDTPLPPLTPPRGPGGPKMAKMHSLKSIDDNLCQKSHFWGVKKIDLFFHSEYTPCPQTGGIVGPPPCRCETGKGTVYGTGYFELLEDQNFYFQPFQL